MIAKTFLICAVLAVAHSTLISSGIAGPGLLNAGLWGPGLLKGAPVATAVRTGTVVSIPGAVTTDKRVIGTTGLVAAGPLGLGLGKGLVGNGLIANGLVSNGLITNGLVGNGLINNGLVGNGLITNGLVGNGLIANGLVGNGLIANGLVSNGLIANGLVANGLLGGAPLGLVGPAGIWGGSGIAKAII